MFFGYGSLVNRATHGYADACTARLTGWRRLWVATPARPQAYLSVYPAPGVLLGLAAAVPGGDWAALDLREAAYRRHPVMVATERGALAVQVYAVPGGDRPAGPGHRLVLSYIDCVVQGFLREYGAAGAVHFFATTDGWDSPVLDDRRAPLYPRAQRLTDAERATVDAGLRSVGARVVLA